MINALPIIWLVWLIVRAINKRDGSPSRARRVGGTRSGNVLMRPISERAGFLFVWFAGELVVAAAIIALPRSPMVSASVLCAMTVVLLPWLLARGVLIPLGLMRPSAIAARLALWTFRNDSGEGASSLAAALALAHKRGSRERDAERLRARLAEPSRIPLRGSKIAAHAVLAAIGGDHARALCLFESIDSLHPLAGAGVARRLAARFRMADAASRRDWPALAAQAAAHRRLTRSAWFFGALAAWHRGRRSAWSALWVRLWWIVASGRRRNRELVAAAFAATAAADLALEQDAVGASEWPHSVLPPFDEALRSHAALARTPDGPGVGEAWRACAAAWQRVFEDRASAEQAIERGKALGVQAPAQMLSAFGSLVRADLASDALRPGVSARDLSDGGPLGVWVASHLADEVLRDLDYRSGAIHERDRARKQVPIVDDWVELATIHSKIERSADRLGDLFVHSAFSCVHVRVSNHAARIYNLQEERAIANAVFRWLARYAERAGDGEALERYRKNLALGF